MRADDSAVSVSERTLPRRLDAPHCRLRMLSLG
jgi:hypothetical protein